MQDIERITKELYNRTILKKIEWKQTNYQNRFVTKLGKGSVTIEKTNGFVSLLFFNSSGEKIDEVSVLNFTTLKSEFLDEFWELVIDNILHKSDTINSMLEELGLTDI